MACEDSNKILITLENIISFTFILGIIGYLLIIISLFLPWHSFIQINLIERTEIHVIYYLSDANNYTTEHFNYNLFPAIFGNLITIIFLLLFWIKRIFPSMLFIFDLLITNIVLLINNLFALDFPNRGFTYGFYTYSVAIILLFIMMVLSIVATIRLKMKKKREKLTERIQSYQFLV